MQIKKNNRAIVFIANQHYSFALASMLVNLKNKLSFDYHVIVYHFGIPKNEQSALTKIEKNISFIEYTYHDWLQEHSRVDSESRALKSFVNRFTHLALSKYKVFEQLEFFEQVLYLDLDMLIEDDISDIFKIKGVAWRTEAEFHNKFGKKEHRPQSDKLTQIPNDFPAPNGGLLFLSDIFNWKECLNDGRDFINTYASYFGSVVDELSLSWIAYHNNLKIHELDYKIYNTLPKVANEQTKIVHFMGKQKTWNNKFLTYGFPAWYRNYKRAIKISEFNFSGVTQFEHHGQTYRKISNQNRWLDFLNYQNLSIPGTLNLKYDISNEELSLQFNSIVTYIITLNPNNRFYTISLHIDNKHLVSDKAILLEIDNIVNRNPEEISLRTLRNSLTLTSRWIDESKISSFFEYFYKLTQPVLEKM